jgi:UDP-glucose 4-epimerase
MVVGDILDRKMVFRAVEGCDYVYNFAGIADLDDASTKPLDTVHLNIAGSINIMDATLKAKAKRYIYASTIYVYSEKGGFYRCSKQAAELYVEEYQRRFGLDFTILRYGTLYGPRADARNSIHRYLIEALRHGAITCAGSTDSVRDYVHVSDAATLSVQILASQYSRKHIIISGLHPIKFKEMILIIEEILGKKLSVVTPNRESAAHYDYTPYSFVPKIGSKLTSNLYTDLGQGILECLHEIHAKNQK